MRDDPDFRYSFAHTPFVRARLEPVRAVVIHTTGGIRPPRGVYDTLRQRGLSVHYIVGSDGEVLQTAPHSLVCLHAGKANPWTVGIELVSPLLAASKPARVERERGVRRRVYRDRVRGRRAVDLVALTDAQMDATLLLVETLCDQLRLPRVVPVEADGSLMRREMAPEELGAFRGVMGHVHCHAVKIDPGTDVMEALRQRWMQRAA
jgi:N-acetyl-anhydromuramyl-L-alanine amidase AmpD